ncbi:hypothetical protein [Rhodococcus opacus]|uniref:hypothetical protein n=1 Tax=Rhodococcus opacus TaxID=37919 RepID=UPI001C468D1F|nr:hypothetical protein [Rhodococcus opacus]MBV6758378.1 hypothetical protein [Rhodococcus opacus]
MTAPAVAKTTTAGDLTHADSGHTVQIAGQLYELLAVQRNRAEVLLAVQPRSGTAKPLFVAPETTVEIMETKK